VTLVVADSGPGVPAELGEKIFEPYVTTKASGTGVGLALSRQIAGHHGGAIHVDRCPDLGGARFTVTLIAANDRRSETQGV
jgi:two-component system sensor kinase FixL